jgi:hypothetical protein
MEIHREIMAGSARISSETLSESCGAGRLEMDNCDQQKDGANDREEKARWMKERAVCRSGKDSCDQASHHRAADADKGRHPKAHVPRAWDEAAGDETDDEPDDDGPYDMKHDVFSLGVVRQAKLLSKSGMQQSSFTYF